MADRPTAKDRLAGRAGEIWQAYIRGVTQESLAAKYGISHQRVSQILKDVRDSIEPETIDAFNRRTLDLLAKLTADHTAIIDAGPTPKIAPTGRIIVNADTGETIPDWSQVMQAASNVVKFTERAAKILGSDAAAKQDVVVTTAPEDIELVERIRAWKASKAQEPE